MHRKSDPGLEYLESQRTWAHRSYPDIQRVDRFLKVLEKDPRAFRRSKQYLLSEQIPLQPNLARLKIPYLDILATRQTRREPGRRAINLEDLSTLLIGSYGMQNQMPGADPSRDWQRTTPSPGGLYSSEIYYLSIATEGLSPGLYHFHPESASLEILDWLVPEEALKQLILFADTPAPNGVILVNGVFKRLRAKYGHRYLRFALLEAGAVCNNLDHVATALRLHLWHQGGVDEQSVRALLRTDSFEEATLHAAVVVGASNKPSP